MNQHQQYDDFSDVDQWQPNLRPEAPMPAGPEILPVGNYDLVIEHAELTRTTGDRPQSIFRLHLSVAAGPYQNTRFSKAYWFSSQKNADFLAGDLLTLGVNTGLWSQSNRPLSQELLEAAFALRGIRFSGQVTEFAKNDGTKGHDLRVRARLSGRPMPPSGVRQPQPAPARPQPPRQPAQQPAFDSYAGQEDSIPF